MPLYNPNTSSGGGTKEFFIPLLEQISSASSGYDSNSDNFPTNKLQNAENAAGVFLVPQDFTTLTNLELLVFGEATGTWNYSVQYGVTAVGESNNNSTGTKSSTGASLSSGQLTSINISANLPSISPGDYVALRVLSTTTNMGQVLGFRFKYS